MAIGKDISVFKTGNDLSVEGITRRRLKGDTFDIYEFIANTDYTILHNTRRYPSSLDEKTGYMIPGDAYDVFALRYTYFSRVTNTSVVSTLCECRSMDAAIEAGNSIDVLNMAS